MLTNDEDDWRNHAECCLGGNPEDFDPLEATRGGVPKARRATAAEFCANCVVRADCARFADETQTEGLLGGSWRQIKGSRPGMYESIDLLNRDATTRVELLAQPDGFGDLVNGETIAERYGYRDAHSACAVLQRSNIYPITRTRTHETFVYVASDVATYMDSRWKRASQDEARRRDAA